MEKEKEEEEEGLHKERLESMMTKLAAGTFTVPGSCSVEGYTVLDDLPPRGVKGASKAFFAHL